MTEKKEEPFTLTEKQIAKMKEYFKSDQFKIDQAKANEQADKIRKSMEFTWERWCEIKDEPYMLKK